MIRRWVRIKATSCHVASMTIRVLAFAALWTGGVSLTPAPRSSVSSRTGVIVSESFGFDFAESQEENTPSEILGERRLKTEWVKSYKPTATVLEGKPYRVFQEVQEKKLLSVTAQSGLLGALDDLGLTLGDVERLLPIVDKSGVLGLVSKNLPLAIVATGYLLIEPAPILIPLVGSLIQVPAAIWTGLAAVSGGAEAFFVATDNGSPLGLLFIPVFLLSAVLSLIPAAVAGLKNLPPAELA